jgi:hypothetical protein
LLGHSDGHDKNRINKAKDFYQTVAFQKKKRHKSNHPSC